MAESMWTSELGPPTFVCVSINTGVVVEQTSPPHFGCRHLLPFANKNTCCGQGSKIQRAPSLLEDRFTVSQVCLQTSQEPAWAWEEVLLLVIIASALCLSLKEVLKLISSRFSHFPQISCLYLSMICGSTGEHNGGTSCVLNSKIFGNTNFCFPEISSDIKL